MQRTRSTAIVLFLFGLLFLPGQAPAQVYSGGIFRSQPSPTQIAGPTRLDEFVTQGKLRLNLEDAIVLALLNNSDLSVNRAQYDLSRFAIQRAQQPFDPVITSGFAPTRSVSPTVTSLSGASTLSALSQVTNAGYSQQFQTGTALGASFITTRATTNSSFATVNPSFTSGLRSPSRA